MSKHFLREEIATQAKVTTGTPAVHEVDRTFELPRGLYIASVACYLGFLAILATGFSTPGLIIPMAIFAFFIIGGFALPAIWATLKPESKSKAKTWAAFRSRGVMTNTGRLNGGEAAVQVLILPVLIVLWGLAVVTIAALV